MLDRTQISPSEMAAAAGDAAALMKALSNEHRLLILCHLIADDELAVGELVAKIGLSQSALSQHLARLRNEGLVEFRRESQTLFYRVSDESVASVLLVLQRIYCPDPQERSVRKSPISGTGRSRDKRRKGD